MYSKSAFEPCKNSTAFCLPVRHAYTLASDISKEDAFRLVVLLVLRLLYSKIIKMSA